METATLYQCFEQHPVICTDTRNPIKDSLFFAMKGANFNGNAYAKSAVEQGCAYAFVDEAQYADGERILLVDDCLKALQDLARFHRRRLGTRIIGITGTNGKTTTKELVSTALGASYEVLYTQGNLNNHLGVPLTLLRLRPSHQLAVIEMGANHPGEIRTLVDIVEPDFGLITNVGKAHLEGFGSFEGVKKTKGELYDFLASKGCRGFVNADSADLMSMARERGLQLIPYGEGADNYVQGRVAAADPYITVDCTCFDERISIPTHLIGTYNLPNVLAAVCVARYFDVPLKKIAAALQAYQPSNNRSQLLKTQRNTLIVDAYNANPTSMAAAIHNFAAITAPDKMLILGDMGELGADSPAEHRKVLDLLHQNGFEQVWLVGPKFAAEDQAYRHFANVQEVQAELQAQPVQGKTILIKGSNAQKLFTLPESL
ncbi:MAG: UDP-N-acetylmuramoyl-tripeptide--D-alanyl-D-alanine ligase [Paludibacteraceae bacterium]|nr:UDP-N-acetylmuramoyl-tripeptide--D-alanyl-D-alanine ligase [Paludibacteraceae bacterium]